MPKIEKKKKKTSNVLKFSFTETLIHVHNKNINNTWSFAFMKNPFSVS